MITTESAERNVHHFHRPMSFRIIQSIPSKKAEPVKQWLASSASNSICKSRCTKTAFQIKNLKKNGTYTCECHFFCVILHPKWELYVGECAQKDLKSSEKFLISRILSTPCLPCAGGLEGFITY